MTAPRRCKERKGPNYGKRRDDSLNSKDTHEHRVETTRRGREHWLAAERQIAKDYLGKKNRDIVCSNRCNIRDNPFARVGPKTERVTSTLHIPWLPCYP
jgi:hypothetical protein